MAELRIEDDDGFVTVHPWPEGRTILANGEFVALCEAAHDAARRDDPPGGEG